MNAGLPGQNKRIAGSVSLYKLFRLFINSARIDQVSSNLPVILFLIETVPSIPLERIGQENIGGLVRYIQAAVWHQLPKLRRRQREMMGYLEDLPLEVESPRSSLEEEVNFRLWLRPLTEKQKRIIQMSYLYQLSDQEIAGILGISRQAVYKIRQSAIKKLRKEWQ